MCSRAPAHIPGNCPGIFVPPPGQEGNSTRLRDMFEELARVETVKKRYPVGPWPFQKAALAALRTG